MTRKIFYFITLLYAALFVIIFFSGIFNSVKYYSYAESIKYCALAYLVFYVYAAALFNDESERYFVFLWINGAWALLMLLFAISVLASHYAHIYPGYVLPFLIILLLLLILPFFAALENRLLNRIIIFSSIGIYVPFGCSCSASEGGDIFGFAWILPYIVMVIPLMINGVHLHILYKRARETEN